mmetsp:Transcript_4270/g.8367  ORF Transcript_4270/g.8367 Transcript_4270/m.8367 type:complete len:206 (+) Transcript_4270:2123-2740(+)
MYLNHAQILRMEPGGEISVFSGHLGEEDSIDQIRTVTYSMPSGICSFKGSLFVVDSDSSTVCQLDINGRQARTLIGGDVLFSRNRSAFGDRDGYGSNARLQRPMGICNYEDGRFLLVDCFNNRIKVISLEGSECRSVAGSGEIGYRDGPRDIAKFNCPSGVDYDAHSRRGFIADQGNHRIRILDGESGFVSTLYITNMPVDPVGL